MHWPYATAKLLVDVGPSIRVAHYYILFHTNIAYYLYCFPCTFIMLFTSCSIPCYFISTLSYDDARGNICLCVSLHALIYSHIFIHSLQCYLSQWHMIIYYAIPLIHYCLLLYIIIHHIVWYYILLHVILIPRIFLYSLVCYFISLYIAIYYSISSYIHIHYHISFHHVVWYNIFLYNITDHHSITYYYVIAFLYSLIVLYIITPCCMM